MVANNNRPILRFSLLSYAIIYSFWKHTVAVPVHLPKTSHNSQFTPAPHPMISTWKYTLANAIPRKVFTSESTPTENNMRSGPLAAVFRATLSTASSIPCTANDPHSKCEVGLHGFGTIREVQYRFIDSEENLKGQSTQVLISCRCLKDDCKTAILVRAVKVMKRNENGSLIPSDERSVCLYQAVKDKFSDCHRELFRVSYRNKDHRRNVLQNNGRVVSYSVADDRHGDYWTARGYRGMKTECLESDIKKLQRVNLSALSEKDIDFNDVPDSESSPCVPPTGVQYFRGDDENEDELCRNLFERALDSALHIASQQDCYGIGKREISYMNPKSAALITDTELALTCSSAVLGILWLWSVLWKQLKRGKRATRRLAFAVLVQIGLSYVLEALPLHTALSNEINGRNWRSLIAFTDATSSRISSETGVGGILILTIVLGEAQYLATRVGLVAGLTGLFDFLALTLRMVILIRMSGCWQTNQKNNIVRGSFTNSGVVGSSPKKEGRMSFSSSETSSEKSFAEIDR